ncbi:MAG: efflux transporter outer membrane subunit [Rhodocyclaceae bacterium]|nr:efflux transporter outer membrane subunit [Rhodocyclaceae bacterium]
MNPPTIEPKQLQPQGPGAVSCPGAVDIVDCKRCLVGSAFCAVLTLSVALTGCAVGPDFRQPAAPTNSSYTPQALVAETASPTGRDGGSQRFLVGNDIPEQWWSLFHSAALDGLVREALEKSPTLGAAQAALRAARENLVAERGGLLYPSIGASATGARERVSAASLGLPSNGGAGGNPELTVINASLNASYNPDVFGGARRRIEGVAAQADFAQFELEATFLTLTSSIAATAIKEASLRAQLQATREVLAAEERQLAVVQRQYDLGAVSRVALLGQQTQAASTRAALPGLEKTLTQTRHQLAVLAGRLPSDADLPEFTLDALQLPPELPVTLPSALVRQRPDILASEALLHQASAQIGVATAALYPQFTLTAQYGRAAGTWSGLFKSQNIVWSFLAGVAQPIFNGGQLTAQRRAAVAAFEQAAHQYRQTVLQAFANVADALRALEADAVALAAIADSDALAKRTLDLTQAQYRLGAVSYLALLDAQRQYQLAHVNLVQAQASRLSDTAGLFQALGGGWWNRTAPLADVPADSGAAK